MRLFLSSAAGPNYLVHVWEISITGKGLLLLSKDCGSDSKQRKRSKADASVRTPQDTPGVSALLRKTGKKPNEMTYILFIFN